MCERADRRGSRNRFSQATAARKASGTASQNSAVSSRAGTTNALTRARVGVDTVKMHVDRICQKLDIAGTSRSRVLAGSGPSNWAW
jgi:hypothetical protein